MAIFEWNDSYSVKIGSIDNQHKKLVQLINTLHDAMKTGKSTTVIGPIISELTNYTVTHFSNEEKYFDQFKYPFSLTHKLEHKKFVKKVLEFKQDYDNGKSILSMDITKFLTSWLTEHIIGVDQKYSDFMIKNGVK